MSDDAILRARWVDSLMSGLDRYRQQILVKEIHLNPQNSAVGVQVSLTLSTGKHIHFEITGPDSVRLTQTDSLFTMDGAVGVVEGALDNRQDI